MRITGGSSGLLSRRDFVRVSALAGTGAAVGRAAGPALASDAEDAADAAPSSGASALGGRYNVLLVTVDQQHYFDECPEGTNWRARQLLAEMGTTFEKHYACSNMSTSSRSVMYTGTHITDTKMLDNTDFAWQGALSEDITTIADRMNRAGYYSAYKGKWHMGNASLLEAEEDPLTDLSGYGFSDWGEGGDCVGSAWEGHETDPDIVRDAVEWLEGTGRDLNEQGRPFFLAVNLINPHDVMDLATQEGFEGDLDLREPPDDETYEKTYDIPLPSTWEDDLSGAVEAVRSYKRKWEGQTGTIEGEEGYRELRDYYLNCIQDSDDNLTTLLEALDELGLYDDTVVIFTADHGEMQGAHGLKGKGGFIYENNVHVPLVICHPDYEGGGTVGAVTSHVDLAPTIVALAASSEDERRELSEGLVGESLMPLVSGEETSVREGSLFCYEMLSFAGDRETGEDGSQTVDLDNRRFVRAVIGSRYKFARYFSPEDFNTPQSLEELVAHNDLELYDLEDDPDETVNLAADPQAHEELLMEMNEALNELIAREIGTDDGAEFRETLAAYVQAQQAGDEG